jgi:hypothetical protein
MDITFMKAFMDTPDILDTKVIMDTTVIKPIKDIKAIIANMETVSTTMI